MLLWIVTMAGGVTLALLWIVLGGCRRAADVDHRRGPEQRLPALVVLLHGLAAAATLVAVLLAVAG